MWCKEEKTGNPFPESHFSPGQTGDIHNPAEHQNNYTGQEQPDPMHPRSIGRFLCFPQDYHRIKSACHSEANRKLGLVDHFPSRREVGRVSKPVILLFPAVVTCAGRRSWTLQPKSFKLSSITIFSSVSAKPLPLPLPSVLSVLQPSSYDSRQRPFALV